MMCFIIRTYELVFSSQNSLIHTFWGHLLQTFTSLSLHNIVDSLKLHDVSGKPTELITWDVLLGERIQRVVKIPSGHYIG